MKLAALWQQALPDETVRELTHADDDLIYQFQVAHPDYFNHFQDHPVTRQEAIQDVTDLPFKALPEQKAYLGVFHQGHLVLIVDLIIDYPLPSLVWLGLWMADKSLTHDDQRTLYQSLKTVLQRVEAVQLQLNVFMGDRDATTFWQDCGLTPIRTTSIVREARTANVTIYQDKFTD
ncbi:acetyltransferase [Levilactobacillus senmaizukei DSM 21775 = NBRC 103853]|uniref:Acetyltransferase n=1 Tax=Levilactobacillus senmaizukei DSM 21775 = NBRC 103853 TaxID=1423803 RepID=A0A0R2DEL1_9LACO|nr:hypothetical protein [Levilactobacillus senmaizukei]KRN02433.1 acetyltransferase [Levilactobacillus senmaizukei DSM 21775 = NBRC 103853]